MRALAALAPSRQHIQHQYGNRYFRPCSFWVLVRRRWGGNKSSTVGSAWVFEVWTGEKHSPARSRSRKSIISRALQIGNRQVVVNPCGSSVLTALLIHQPSAWMRAARVVCASGVICFRRLVSFIGVILGAELWYGAGMLETFSEM